MKRIVTVLTGTLAAVVLATGLVAPAQAGYQPTITGTVKCVNRGHSTNAVVTWSVPGDQTVLGSWNPEAVGLTAPFSIDETVAGPGVQSFVVEYDGDQSVDNAGDVTVPDCDGPGYAKPKTYPFHVFKRTHRRHVLKVRKVTRDYRIATDRDGNEFWAPVVRRGHWHRAHR
jgi:hypothetical protein